MSAAGRPVYQPPPVPPVDVPAVAPVLLAPERRPVDWIAHWRTIAGALGCLMAGGIAAWGAWVDLGAPPPLVVSLTALWAAVWLLRLRIEALAFTADLTQDRARRQAERALLSAQVAAYTQAYAAQAELALAYGRKHYAAGKAEPPADPAPVVYPTPAERDLAAYRAEVADLRALLERLQPPPSTPEPERARVVPPEFVTQHLDPARDLLAAAYLHGPTALLVERARAGKSTAAGPLTTGAVKSMSDPQWRAATKALRRAGVFGQAAANQPWQLAADLRDTDVTELHQIVIDRLLAAGVVPADLPGDMQDLQSVWGD